jgi:GNAT superfamily N-acetyltransferase
MTILIRSLQKNELPAASQIFRLAFGTFIGLPEPDSFASDRNYMNRWYPDPTAAFAAEAGGRLIGSNIAVNWGSFGLFGPLTVHPDYWGCQAGQQLIAAAVDRFEHWQVTQSGLFTFSSSAKHLALYQKFGFYPRFLTVVMSKPVQPAARNLETVHYSELSEEQKAECLKACFELTDSLYNGLDLRREIETVAAQNLGETVLLWSRDNLLGFAICHCGEGTEAGKDNCYVKFGAVRSTQTSESDFEQLLQACEALGVKQGLKNLVCGVNTERQAAYQKMLALGFRIDVIGIAMCRPSQPGFNRADVFVIDDWR